MFDCSVWRLFGKMVSQDSSDILCGIFCRVILVESSVFPILQLLISFDYAAFDIFSRKRFHQSFILCDEQRSISFESMCFCNSFPGRCFESFVQNVVDSRREGDQNKELTVVAKTMKLIGYSSYDCQIMVDRSQHANTKYVEGSQVDKFINKKFFKTMNELPEQIYEVEMSRSRINHKEPKIIGFFILQFAKLTMLQLKYNFFSRFCDKNKHGLIEKNTSSVHVALSEEKLDEIVRSEMRSLWYWMRQSDCTDNFAANSSSNFFPREFCKKHAAFDKRTSVLFKEEFRCSEMIALCSKTYCCYNEETDTV